MADELEIYLKSEILYWQLSPSVPITPPPPMLTLGGFWFRAHRLAGVKHDSLQTRELTAINRSVAEIIGRWPVHAGQHVSQELEARLKSWNWFIDDCQEKKQSAVAYYATEAELRTTLAHLLRFGSQYADVSQHRDQLARLDGGLRACFKRGDFVWRSALEPAYPKSEFWWLYGRPEFQHP